MNARRIAVLAATAAAVTLPVLAAPAATAAPQQVTTAASHDCHDPGPWGIHAKAVTLRSKPTTKSTALGILYKGHKFSVHSTKGNWVNVTDKTTGVRGWASQNYVYRDVYMCLD
ncbi:SH3 domain-containing protein [Streptomyces sp. NPDC014983]|uniref:SH3 domain-containing protein n=1 Tax=Streptomyces sp. NPDC014983 TaxID=3364933 RepID=UPI0036FC21E1